jgi:uncharacterized protein YjcR
VSKNRQFDHEEIKSMYASGLKLAYIAAIHGCSINTVSAVANRYGLRRRELRQLMPSHLKAMQMYLQGAPLKQIRAETGLQDSQIYQTMNKYGVRQRRNNVKR